MKKKTLVWAVASAAWLAVLVPACGSEAEPAGSEDKPSPKRTAVEVVTDWSEGSQGVRELLVNGRPCIETYQQFNRGLGNGISCFWGS